MRFVLAKVFDWKKPSMGQFLDSAAFAGATAAGTPTPPDAKKTTMVPTSGATSPVATLAVSSVMSAFGSGGTRLSLSIHIYARMNVFVSRF